MATAPTIDDKHRTAPDWASMTQEEKSEHYQNVTRRYLEAKVDEDQAKDFTDVAWINMPPEVQAKHSY